ncbi:Isopenicillin N synthase [Tistlia consotensis]|uniref:2-oxoglutarate-dependent ethylene/succinate-forming enzyme n=1 Tax=Tistlia consotensis USBA 355 TaxID=560819 RepID=A0A1Y6C5M9_9PROT|nr:2OG-Fe(II) oxygenase family protein [Tistlia consotensis]SMF37352.1 Isopenicillin N synthase [Tistlia consotensis USBA 355]SNR72704.1 Isopenicillin N synthase [Tistlia consotensis]
MDAIPTIEVAALDGTAAERHACAEAIGRACREVGFFRIVGHGVEPALLQRAFAVAQGFFALPPEAKAAVALGPASGYRGYFPLRGEVTDPAAGGDPKEGFDIAFGAAGELNRWPAGLPELKTVLSAYYEAIAALGRTLSRGFALALELPEDFFAAKLDRPTAILRVLHYPPAGWPVDPAELPAGCGAHSDYGYLTILAQDTQGGLQVERRDGRWLDVPPEEGSFVCNIGEMMARWTADRFRATPHRVVRVAPGARYSIPFFFHPNPDVLIETLPTCRREGAPLYPPITSGDYLDRRQAGAYA